jgi:integrase
LSKFIPVEPGILKSWNKTEKRFIYYLDYYDEHGERKRPSTGTGSLTFARELLINRKDEIAKRKKLPDRYIPKVKFSDFVDNEYIAIHVRGSKYEANIKGICKKLKNYFGDKFLHEINSRMVEVYKKERIETVRIIREEKKKIAENTINNELNTLSGIFTKAIKWGKALINPVHKVKRFRSKERKRILEQWEQEALIIASGKEKKAPHLQAMVIFDLYTGLRKEELLNLKWSDVDFVNEQMHVRAEIAKYNKDRYIDLTIQALTVLRSLPQRGEYVFCDKQGNPFKNFRRSFESSVTRAKLKDVVIHDLRRTYGSNCIMAGVSLATVQKWMGHSSINTTIKHYGHLAESFRKEEVKKLEGRMDTCMDTWLKDFTEEAYKSLKNMVPPAGIEPATPGLNLWHIILLSCFCISMNITITDYGSNLH